MTSSLMLPLPSKGRSKSADCKMVSMSSPVGIIVNGSMNVAEDADDAEPITSLLDDLVDKYSNMSFASSSRIHYVAELSAATEEGPITFTVPDNVREESLLDWIWEHRRKELSRTIVFKKYSSRIDRKTDATQFSDTYESSEGKSQKQQQKHEGYAQQQTVNYTKENLIEWCEEIRTPVTGLIKSAQSLQIDTAKLSDAQHQAIKSVLRFGQQLVQWMECVQERETLDTHVVSSDAPTNLQETLNAVVAKTSSRQPQEQQPQLVTKYDAHVPEFANTDGRLLQQILVRLVENALLRPMSSPTCAPVQLLAYAGTKQGIETACRRSDIEELDEEGLDHVGLEATSISTSSSSADASLSTNLLAASTSNGSISSVDVNDDTKYLRFIVRDPRGQRRKSRVKVIKEDVTRKSISLSNVSKMLQLLGSDLCLGDSPTGEETDCTFDIVLSGSVPADVSMMSQTLKNATLLFVGNVSHGETALTAMARADIDIIQVDTCAELRVLIESKTALDPQRTYMCLMQENLYEAQTFQALASVARSVLLTFGPNRIVRDGKRHFVSLDRTLPSLILKAMVSCVKAVSVINSNHSRLRSNKPPRPTRRSTSERSESVNSSPPKPPPTSPSSACARPVNFDLSTVKVLIAEDNRINQKVLIRMLKRLGMKDIDVVTTCKDAVESCRQSSYNFVFIDHQMPNMDGIEACRIIKQEQQQQNPVIVVNNDEDDDEDNGPTIVFVTANTSEEFRKHAYLAGGAGFISKPFDIRAIEAYFKTQTKLSRTRPSTRSA